MVVSHQLALPLPRGYHTPECVRGDYAVFVDSNTECTIPAPVEQYLNDLLNFLTSTKLIQRHPDDFFDFFGNFAEEEARHTDGTCITEEEKEELNHFCASFNPLFDSGSMEENLANLVKNGPPLSSTSLLNFFQMTCCLQLYRQRHVLNNGISFTATTKSEFELCQTDEPILNDKQLRKLDLVLSHGMSRKKQHEVEIMCHTVNDLVKCCSSTMNETSNSTSLKTVINIGEGKGYVSRGLSLVCGLQVIGLDCNPSHKTKMVERTDILLQASINAFKRKRLNSSYASCTTSNMLYEPSGFLTSIACKVEKSVDWTALLRGVTLTVNSISGERSTENELFPAQDEGEDASSVGNAIKLSNMEHKMKCHFCARIVRHSVPLLARHAHEHVKNNEVFPATGITVKKIEEWNQTLGPYAFIKKLIECYFQTCDNVESCAQAYWINILEQQDHEKKNALALFPVYISRGYRVQLLCSAAISSRGKLDNKGCKRREKASCDATLSHSTSFPSIERRVGTVIGYDDATKLHSLIFDNAHGTFRMILAQTSHKTNLDDLNEQDHHRKMFSSLPIGVIEDVFPFVPPTKSYVDVPFLRNTVMIGLHTCGDLGSNICRIFSESGSRGLLLVSCCWHALTFDGFPLSNFLRHRGASIDKISLLLATQPFDMWGTNSSKGHQSSAKLLFFRSLLKLLWKQLAKKWEECISSASPPCCTFAPLPHLEPYFLRLMATKKHELSFSNFFSDVLEHFIFKETMRKTAYTWDKFVCLACRIKQENFFREHSELGVARKLEGEMFGTCFPSFLGLTVLRMWMCHTVESLLLLDRTLFLFEKSYTSCDKKESLAVSLFPLFDGSISPRLFAICARRF